MYFTIEKKEAFRGTDEEWQALPAFDNTKLVAVNTCPTWGVIRYGLHKVFSNSSRSMALEAGEACHQAFAMARIADLIEYGPALYGPEIVSIAEERTRVMFGSERATEALNRLKSNEERRERFIASCLYILESSGFYDDPQDKRRTMDRLCEAMIAYVDRYDFGKNLPYYNKDTNFLGIENSFDLLVTMNGYDAEGDKSEQVRFIGRIDGVHAHHNDLSKPFVEENKTASRLGEAWEQSFDMSHQVTGYMAACSALLDKQEMTNFAIIRGLAIPQPRTYDSGSVTRLPVTRRDHQFVEWSEWFYETVKTYKRWLSNPCRAPKYTHSCNRYFRPCSYIPLCTADYEEREEALREMVIDEWSPLLEKAGE